MTVKPELMTFSDALRYTGFSRTRLYLALPKLDARKAGRRLLIARVSLDALIDSLPRVKKSEAAPDHR